MNAKKYWTFKIEHFLTTDRVVATHTLALEHDDGLVW